MAALVAIRANCGASLQGNLLCLLPEVPLLRSRLAGLLPCRGCVAGCVAQGPGSDRAPSLLLDYSQIIGVDGEADFKSKKANLGAERQEGLLSSTHQGQEDHESGQLHSSSIHCFAGHESEANVVSTQDEEPGVVLQQPLTGNHFVMKLGQP